MFAAARKAAKELISSLPVNADDNLNLPAQSLPEKYSLLQLYERLALDDEKRSKDDKLANLLILTSCLGSSSRLTTSTSDSDPISNLSLWISRAILPDGTFVLNKDGDQTLSSKQRIHSGFLAKQTGTLGLRSLNFLHALTPPSLDPPPPIDNAILLSVLTFTNDEDPWTTSSARSQALNFLSHYTSQTHSSSFLITYLLQSVIRPLFSKSRPSTITSSGRKAMPSSLPPKHHDFTAEQTSKPWKYSAPYSLALLEFAVQSTLDELITAHWSLLIPPLLTLLDDTSTYIRVRGLNLTTSFLPRLPRKILLQSGLSSVFEDAIFPSLSWLPNLTPLGESLDILPAAYQALYTLLETLHPPPSISPSPSPNTPLSLSASSEKGKQAEQEQARQSQKARLAFLDKLFRTGIFPSYTHASTHPSLVCILLSALSTIVQKMGIHSVKHLKDIIPMLSAVLCDPFATSDEDLMLEGVKALKVAVLNCWPRLGEEGWRVEVVRCCVVGWKGVCEALGGEGKGREDGDELRKIQEEIKVAGRLLVKAVAVHEEVDFATELRPLIEVDAKLVEDVFGITTPTK
ncbi:hypothetical protein L207DRAFT_642083 [Hyaloscypha variabilis F]|uniref:DUF1941-domain-containing protein n=1 Tax=Hyaloscypha variabilis (strain UAMH 11265 / GT02V1 / F) TaxID=1149755 RepID=A0A2J6QUQ1_HYAVF|nr:hypothetical protein L207DRAFT_642083 [Hyaloscypha variabilis F]